MFPRIALAILLAASAVFAAAQVRLWLRDGGYHVVREYKVLEDRIRYYSVERGDWEEIPKELVDLKRTEREISEKEGARTAEQKAIAEEEQAEREHLARIARVPENPGAYYEEGNEFKALLLAESKLVTDKKRSILKVMSPLPVFAGKATVEVDGDKSKQVLTGKRPEIYLRLSDDENFAIVRALPGKKGSRIIEKVSVDPVAREMKYEEPEIIETFRQQLGDRLFKIWPMEDLPPGEYAVIQYTPGKVNPQIWDFGLAAGK